MPTDRILMIARQRTRKKNRWVAAYRSHSEE